jgi:hypothetical protein
MMRLRCPRLACQLAALLILATLPSIAQAQAPRDRILRAIDNSEITQLRGNIHPLARAEFDRGRVADSMSLPRVTIFFTPTSEQQADLKLLLTEQQDHSSPNYHHWLTPEEFGNRFGLSPNDLNKIVAWLESRGFTVQAIPASRNFVSFSGTAARASAAFHAEIHRYVVNGVQHYANSGAPWLPAALADVVAGIRGLTDFRLRPMSIRRLMPRAAPQYTSGSSTHFLAPDDFATIYDVKPLYSKGIDGTGQKIAIVGQSDIQLADIEEFRSMMSLPSNDPQTILLPGVSDPGAINDDLQEADLDLEWAGAVARNAALLYVNSNNVIDSLQYAVTNDLAPVVSFSYGICEPEVSQSEMEFLASLGQQANSQGQTIVASSGDSGAANCDAPFLPNSVATQGLAVSVPANLPYVTAVGGTEFNESSGTYWSSANNAENGSALSYIPEIAWNDTSSSYGLGATGGGASTYFSKPMWQAASGVPNDSARDIPDVALSASGEHDGYIMCSEQYNSQTQTFIPVCPGSFFISGGTSASAPAFAGIVALLNQAMNSSQGNVNYLLYQAANLPVNPFHDAPSGSNAVPCQTNPDSPDCPVSGGSAGFIGYPAAAGYDLATGLGSVDADILVTNWPAVSLSPNFGLSVSPAALVVSRGSSATAQITVTTVGGLTGSPALTCNVPPVFLDVTCSITLNAATKTYTLTIQALNTATAFSPAAAIETQTPGNDPANFGAFFRLNVFARFAAVLPTGGRTYFLGMFLAVASILACWPVGWERRELGDRGGSVAKSAPVLLAASATIALLLLGCAGATATGGGSAQNKNAPTSVQLAPQAVVLGQNQQQQFTASVANSTSSVIWSATPNVGSSAVVAGNSALDIYSAPAVIAANQTIILTATSAADATKQASATILLTAPVSGAIQVVGSINGLTHSAAVTVNVN